MKRIIIAIAASVAMLAAMVGLPAVANAAGVCDKANAQHTLVGWQGTGMGAYFADGNVWNQNGSVDQTMYVCDTDSWYADVKASDQGDGAVLSYPNVHRDYYDWSTKTMPKMSDYSAVETKFAHKTGEGAVNYDWAYDVWLNWDGSNDVELMIWTECKKQRPYGTKRGTYTVDGHQWELWTGDNDHYVAYVATEPMDSGTLDLKKFTEHLHSVGRINADPELGQVGYGPEIVDTAGQQVRFDVTDFWVEGREGPSETESPDPSDTPTPDPTDTEEPPKGDGPTVDAGYTHVTPTPNVPTTTHVDFPEGKFDSAPAVTATANSTVPGKSVVEVSVTNVTKTGFDLVLYRKTAVKTGVYWQAIEQ